MRLEEELEVTCFIKKEKKPIKSIISDEVPDSA